MMTYHDGHNILLQINVPVLEQRDPKLCVRDIGNFADIIDDLYALSQIDWTGKFVE